MMTATLKQPRSPLKIHLHAQVQIRMGPFLHALIAGPHRRYPIKMRYKKAQGRITSKDKNTPVAKEAEAQTAAEPARQPNQADRSATRRTISGLHSPCTARVTSRVAVRSSSSSMKRCIVCVRHEITT